MDYLGENQEKNVDAFVRYWNAYRKSSERQGTLDWWRGYLFSEEFQNIRFHPQVVHLLAGERAWRCLRHDFFHIDYMTDEIKGLLWEAYGFQEDDGTAYQGEVHKLWIFLHPKHIRRRMKERTKHEYLEDTRHRADNRQKSHQKSLCGENKGDSPGGCAGGV